MSEHTPGPWEIHDKNFGFQIISKTHRGLDVVALVNREIVQEEESYANARLIAAAPSLLEALERLYACAEKIPGIHEQYWRNTLHMAELAMNKATEGESS